MTKAIIFDLDSCLSAADEPGQQLFGPGLQRDHSRQPRLAQSGNTLELKPLLDWKG